MSSHNIHHLNNYVDSEESQRAEFMAQLHSFMLEQGRPLSKIPIMGYKELDLFQLFREVVAFGGFGEVVKNVGTWSKIWKRLSNFDPSITDSSFRLKKNYERYLLQYEFKLYPSHRDASEGVGRRSLPSSMSMSLISSHDSFGTGSPAGAVAARRARTRQRKLDASSLARHEDGSVVMPLVLEDGELIVMELGEVLPHAPFSTEKHIWPVGFTAIRRFASMKSPERSVQYTCSIEAGEKPQFVVVAEDDPMNPIISHSPSAAWRTVLKRVQAAAAAAAAAAASSPSTPSAADDMTPPMSPPGSPQHDAELVMAASVLPSPASRVQAAVAAAAAASTPNRVRGTHLYGLAHPLVAQLVKSMPCADVLVKPPKRSRSEMNLNELCGSDDEKDASLLMDFMDVESAQSPAGRPAKRLAARRPASSRVVVATNFDEDLSDVVESAIATLHSWRSMTVA